MSVKLFYREPLPVDTSFTNKPVPVCVLSTLKIIFCLSQHFHHKIGARPNSHLCVDTDPLRSDKPLSLSHDDNCGTALLWSHRPGRGGETGEPDL